MAAAPRQSNQTKVATDAEIASAIDSFKSTAMTPEQIRTRMDNLSQNSSYAPCARCQNQPMKDKMQGCCSLKCMALVRRWSPPRCPTEVPFVCCVPGCERITTPHGKFCGSAHDDWYGRKHLFFRLWMNDARAEEAARGKEAAKPEEVASVGVSAHNWTQLDAQQNWPLGTSLGSPHDHGWQVL